MKITAFGSYSKRIDYTQQDLGSGFVYDNLNNLTINSFYHFRDKILETIFKKYFPIKSKDKTRTLSLKKVIVGPSKLSFEKVRSSLVSYDFPIHLAFSYNICENRIKLASINYYKTHLDALRKWLKQKLNFVEPKLLNQKGSVYTFTDQKSTNKKIKAKIIVQGIVDNDLFFDLDFKNDAKVFFGNYPMISDKGTFLINGNEKVVVFQLSRAPGVYFNKVEDHHNIQLFAGEIIPQQGIWIDFVFRNVNFKDEDKNAVNAPVLHLIPDKVKVNYILLTDLLTIVGLEPTAVLDLLNHNETIVNSYRMYSGGAFSTESAVNRICNQIPFVTGSQTFNNKFKTIVSKFFDRLILSEVGRYKFNHKLFVGNNLYNRVLAKNLVDYRSKKIIFTKGTWISQRVWPKIKEFLLQGNNLETLEFAKTKVAGSNRVQVVEVYANNDEQDKVIKLVGVDPTCSDFTFTVPDLLATISYLLNLPYDVGSVDDIDSLANRNVKTIGELLEYRFYSGLKKIRDEVVRRLGDLTLDKYNYHISSLINSGPLLDTVREFFNVSQLCQFLDQTNPLAELSNKRRITILGESGLKRESASAKVRDIHPSYFGKICPIETPEGPNIGLITNLAFYASLNKHRFIETPYWKVKKGVVTKKIVYLSALEEEGLIIAPATTPCDQNRNILPDRLSVYLGDNLVTVHREDVEYLGYSSQQMFSVSTSCIPFLQHNDANRALMGANMQKQAVPLITADSPIIATGNEVAIARDSGFALVSKTAGKVVYADSSLVQIEDEKNKIENYYLTDFLASNQRSALFHNLLVKNGDLVEKNQIIADGPSVKGGELAIGQNLLVAFTTWKGYNFEDALIISDRLVRSDIFTSVHIEEYRIRRLRTSLGEERFTAQVPNTSNESLRFLDENGIALIGSEVAPGDVLVGKVTPRSKGKLTPEDILLNQLFQGREQNLDNNSLVVPNGGGGIVQNIRYYSADDYRGALPADVIEEIRVSIVQKMPVKQGDKLCNRHGNKGVVSRILPESSMPYLADGTPIDIMVNPLGVPSRMNVGQLLELHLSYAATKLGYKVVTPIFNGANINDLNKIIQESKLSPDGKEVLYDGETGQPFDQKIAIGNMYYLKLSHMVETKIHARNTGPYSLVTQQPLKGKAQNGGQRFGEMEVWALESYGAAYNLQELLTIKSDDIKGRNTILNAIIEKRTDTFRFANFPESFNVLIAEMRGLCLNVDILDKSPNELTSREDGEFDNEEEV